MLRCRDDRGQIVSLRAFEEDALVHRRLVREIKHFLPNVVLEVVDGNGKNLLVPAFKLEVSEKCLIELNPTRLRG